jgi:hypothetical protein
MQDITYTNVETKNAKQASSASVGRRECVQT